MSSKETTKPAGDGPVTLPDFARWKRTGRKITVLTAYDHGMAKLVDGSGVDCILVGDSLATVIQGHDTTLPVTLEQMVYHTEMVSRAVTRALVVADMPFLSYQPSIEVAISSAGRCLKEGRSSAVKVEGGRRTASTIRALVESDIPVMGHVGLTPQSIRRLGTYRVQRDADAIKADALAVAEAGAFAIVLECIPGQLAAEITAELSIPTIGIGAGAQCDGQVLVLNDLLGLFEGFRPKHVRRYAELAQEIRRAVAKYVEDVSSGEFPGPGETFS